MCLPCSAFSICLQASHWIAPLFHVVLQAQIGWPKKILVPGSFWPVIGHQRPSPRSLSVLPIAHSATRFWTPIAAALLRVNELEPFLPSVVVVFLSGDVVAVFLPVLPLPLPVVAVLLLSVLLILAKLSIRIVKLDTILVHTSPSAPTIPSSFPMRRQR